MSLSLTPDTAPPEASLPPPRMQVLRVVVALVLREMGSTYGRSPGGYIWAIASPLGGILIMSMAFSLLVRAPSLGTSFLLFYATGYLPFDLFGQLSSKIGNSVRYSRALLAYPRVNWLDAVIARLILNTLTCVTVFCIVIYGIMQVVETRSLLDLRPILVGLLLMVTVGVAVGLLNCLMSGYSPVWDRVWNIVTRPLMIASGIFFLYEDMPPVAQSILWWNPLIHGTALIRTGFYPTYHASFVNLPYAFGGALIVIVMSLIFLRRGYLATFDR